MLNMLLFINLIFILFATKFVILSLIIVELEFTNMTKTGCFLLFTKQYRISLAFQNNILLEIIWEKNTSYHKDVLYIIHLQYDKIKLTSKMKKITNIYWSKKNEMRVSSKICQNWRLTMKRRKICHVTMMEMMET